MDLTECDQSEKQLGCRVEEMTPIQLVAYLKDAMYFHQDVDLRIDGAGHKERAVMTALQRVYGDEGAGRIVKYVMVHYQGRYEGKLVGFFTFEKARKWWTDQMYTEMQGEINRTRHLIGIQNELAEKMVPLRGFFSARH